MTFITAGSEQANWFGAPCHSDPVGTDIILAERRLGEWIAVAEDPEHRTNAMNNYLEALSKLESTNDVATLTLIVPVLQSQQQTLNDAGLSTSELDEYLIERGRPRSC